MNNHQYREALNIPDKSTDWEMCATLPHLFLMGDFDSMMGWKLSTLLDNGMPVLIYNGDQDYLCNYRGGLRWTNALNWLGQEEYRAARFHSWWSSEGDEIGMIKSYKGLTFA